MGQTQVSRQGQVMFIRKGMRGEMGKMQMGT